MLDKQMYKFLKVKYFFIVKFMVLGQPTEVQPQPEQNPPNHAQPELSLSQSPPSNPTSPIFASIHDDIDNLEQDLFELSSPTSPLYSRRFDQPFVPHSLRSSDDHNHHIKDDPLDQLDTELT